MTYDIIGQNYDIIGQNYDIIVSTMISGVPRFQMGKQSAASRCPHRGQPSQLGGSSQFKRCLFLLVANAREKL